jgi:uncharacterized membrane protein YgdD (TMEM256/DUF423 family)
MAFERKWIVLGALLGGSSVALGAFGAHGLRGLVTADLLANYETAARYQMYHALALLAVAFVGARAGAARAANLAGWLFVAGVVIFSGSLYVMTFTGLRWLGAITPIGGAAMIGGWVSLAAAARISYRADRANAP